MESDQLCEVATTSSQMSVMVVKPKNPVKNQKEVRKTVTWTLQNDNAIESSSEEEAIEMTTRDSVCRICHRDASTEALIIPCYCKASYRSAHLSCLEEELKNFDISYCRFCKYSFEIERKTKPLLQWTKNKDERHKLICLMFTTIILCIFFVTVISISIKAVVQFSPIKLVILTDCIFGFFMLAAFSVLIFIYIKFTFESWKKLENCNKKWIIKLKRNQSDQEKHEVNNEDINNNNEETNL